MTWASLAIWAWLALVAGESASLPGFPVENLPVNTSTGILLVDLTGNGRLNVVLTAGEGLLVLDPGGQPLRNFPVRLHDDAFDVVSLRFEAAPTACDLNGDGNLEVVVAGANGRLFAVTTSGSLAPGFPVTLPGVARGPIACLPVGSGKAHDLLLTVDSGQLLRLEGGGGKPQVLAQIGAGAESGVGMGDLDGLGEMHLVVGGGDSKIYAFNLHGQPRAGFPYKMSFRATGVPALGDIDDDGRLDIVVGSEDYKIHAVNAAGKALEGFPVSTQYRLYAGVSLADLDNNGSLDVVAASGDGLLYAVNGQGKALPGFPVQLDGRLTSGVVVGDLDRDGRQELVLVSQGGSVQVLNAAGKPLPGFPWRLGGKLELCPALGDLDNDGHLDMVVQSKAGTVYAVRLPAVDAVPVTVAAWPLTGHDAAHSGRHFPNVGRFKEVAWVNDKPTTTDALQVHYRFFDVDGDAEKDTQIRWYVGDVHQPDLDNRAQVPAERTVKHQVWRYTLQEGNNFRTFGEASVLTQMVPSAPLTVLNTAPKAPAISLTPHLPVTTSPLHVQVTRPSDDADGDALVYRTVWYKDNRPQRWPVDTVHVDPANTLKNEVWRVEVLAFDGEVEGERATEQVSIRNTPPGAAKIILAPSEPRTDDGVQVSIQVPATDDDHDPLTYRYQYWVDDWPLPLAENVAKVPPRILHKHQALRVQVTTVDDEEPGGTAQAELKVVNTPPAPPILAIWPAQPRTRDDLHGVTVQQPADADADRLMLRYRWRVDGAPVEFPGVVPAQATRKGQHWQLEAVPFDGEVAGAPATAETVIQNTPPTAPVMVLDHYALYTDETAAPQVLVPAADDDDDPVQLVYQWERNGQPVPTLTGSTLAPEYTRKGERWELKITPHDGEAAGTSTKVPLQIINAPPGVPEIKLTRQDPTVEDSAGVIISRPAIDRDEDALVYHYRWYKNGEAQALPQTQNTFLPRQGHRGEHWRVEVSAYDGEAEGGPARAELVVQNHAPMPPQVSISPILAHSTDDLHCTVQVPGTDPDADPLTEITRWWVDGQPVELPGDANTVPHSLVHVGQSWECATASFDGALLSAWSRPAARIIVNTPPTAPEVVILPVLPRKRDDLVCGVQEPSADADADTVMYHFAWQVDGKPWVPAKPDVAMAARVPREAMARGQNWECVVTPNDGQANGAPGRAVVTVQNTPPGAPVVGILPAAPVAGHALRCAILQAAHDVDDDTLTYQYTWYRDGIVQTFAPTSDEVPGRLVHGKDLWSCSAVACDKHAQSISATSPDVVVLPAPTP